MPNGFVLLYPSSNSLHTVLTSLSLLNNLAKVERTTHDACLQEGYITMPIRLLLSNVPKDCSEDFLKKWIEDGGYAVSSIRVIADTVSGTSPSFAYVQLTASIKLEEAERMFCGQILQGRRIYVQRVVPPPVVEPAICAAKSLVTRASA